MNATGSSRLVDASADRRGPTVAFAFEGRRLEAPPGATIAAALLANGVSVFGRSSKYHRPRGYRCGRGHCSCCSMRVDGLPGVRTCVTHVRSGMQVEREHAWPNASADVLRGADLLSPLMPPGFYYRWFRRSPRLWGYLERGLARAAGQGALPSPEAARRMSAARCLDRDEVDVLVVGGGIAGIAAALSAADEGAEVLLVHRAARLGGRLADGPTPQPASTRVRDGDAQDLLTEWLAEVDAHASIEVMTEAEAFAWYEEGTIAIDTHPDLVLAGPKAVVLATGAYELGHPFENCDIPGVMLASGARRLLTQHRVRPGSRAAVVTSDDSAIRVALELMDAGIQIACIADLRPPGHVEETLVAELSRRRTPYITESRDLRAHGRNHVTALSVSGPATGTTRFTCDLVCVSAGFRAADELRYQGLSAGSVALDLAGEDGHVNGADGPVPLRVVGQAGGATDAETAAASGRAAGRLAALAAAGKSR